MQTLQDRQLPYKASFNSLFRCISSANSSLTATISTTTFNSLFRCILEVYEGVEIKKLQWSEDLFYLPNKYCPFCGRKFEFYEEVVEVTTNPIFVITGDKEADSIVIAIHLKCLIKDLKKGEEDE